MFLSKFRFYSIGIVAEHKPKDTHQISVIPIEVIPDITGMVAESIDTIDLEGNRADGSVYNVTIKTSMCISAKWLPVTGSNRITSPDVRKGEKVMIMQLGDADKFYWTTLGRDDDLRRLETAVWGFSATADPDEPLDPDTNMYILEISTDTKLIKLTTTMANEEPFAYTIELNTDLGFFKVVDNEGNEISLDSEERIIKAVNSDESKIEINKEEIIAYCRSKIDIHCDGEMIGYIKDKVDVTCDGPFIARAPQMQFGLDDAVQPSVLGDNHAAAHEMLEEQINQSMVIGNLGIPTSTISAVKPVLVPNLNSGGNSYSTVNKNQ